MGSLHRAGKGLAGVDGAFQVDRQYAVPGVRIEVHQVTNAADAGTINQAIKCAETRLGIGNECGHLLPAGNVHDHARHAGACCKFSHHFVHIFLAHIGRRDRRTLRNQAAYIRSANAANRPGHRNRLAFKRNVEKLRSTRTLTCEIVEPEQPRSIGYRGFLLVGGYAPFAHAKEVQLVVSGGSTRKFTLRSVHLPVLH